MKMRMRLKISYRLTAGLGPILAAALAFAPGRAAAQIPVPPGAAPPAAAAGTASPAPAPATALPAPPAAPTPNAAPGGPTVELPPERDMPSTALPRETAIE